MSNPSSPELTVKFAAAVLAVRATRARRCGGLVKTADWKENVQEFIGNLKKPDVNLQRSFTGPKADLTGATHWKSVGMEALRNAIIGAGVGGVGGAASSLLSRRRKKQPFRRALHGALLGGGLGLAGTAVHRGGEFALSGIPSATLEESRRKANVARGGGMAVPGDTAVDDSLLGAAKQDISSLQDVRTPREAMGVIGGFPEATTFGAPAGAVAGGAAGVVAPRGAHHLARIAKHRQDLEEILKSPEAKDVGARPEKFVRRGGVHRGVGKQFQDVNRATARAAITAARKPPPIWAKRLGWRGLIPLLLGAWGGGQLDQATARRLFGQPQYQPQQ